MDQSELRMLNSIEKKRRKNRRPTFCIIDPKTRGMRRLERLSGYVDTNNKRGQLRAKRKLLHCSRGNCDSSPLPPDQRTHGIQRSASHQKRPILLLACDKLKVQVVDPTSSSEECKLRVAEELPKKHHRLRKSSNNMQERKFTSNEALALMEEVGISTRSSSSQDEQIESIRTGRKEATVALPIQIREKKRLKATKNKALTRVSELPKLYESAMQLKHSMVSTPGKNCAIYSVRSALCTSQQSTHADVSNFVMYDSTSVEASQLPFGLLLPKEVTSPTSSEYDTLPSSDIRLPVSQTTRNTQQIDKLQSHASVEENIKSGISHNYVGKCTRLKHDGKDDVNTRHKDAESFSIDRGLDGIHRRTLFKEKVPVKSLEVTEKLNHGYRLQKSFGDVYILLDKTVSTKSATLEQQPSHMIREKPSGKSIKSNLEESLHAARASFSSFSTSGNSEDYISRSKQVSNCPTDEKPKNWQQSTITVPVMQNYNEVMSQYGKKLLSQMKSDCTLAESYSSNEDVENLNAKSTQVTNLTNRGTQTFKYLKCPAMQYCDKYKGSVPAGSRNTLAHSPNRRKSYDRSSDKPESSSESMGSAKSKSFTSATKPALRTLDFKRALGLQSPQEYENLLPQSVNNQTADENITKQKQQDIGMKMHLSSIEIDGLSSNLLMNAKQLASPNHNVAMEEEFRLIKPDPSKLDLRTIELKQPLTLQMPRKCESFHQQAVNVIADKENKSEKRKDVSMKMHLPLIEISGMGSPLLMNACGKPKDVNQYEVPYEFSEINGMGPIAEKRNIWLEQHLETKRVESDSALDQSLPDAQITNEILCVQHRSDSRTQVQHKSMRPCRIPRFVPTKSLTNQIPNQQLITSKMEQQKMPRAQLVHVPRFVPTKSLTNQSANQQLVTSKMVQRKTPRVTNCPKSATLATSEMLGKLSCTDNLTDHSLASSKSASNGGSAIDNLHSATTQSLNTSTVVDIGGMNNETIEERVDQKDEGTAAEIVGERNEFLPKIMNSLWNVFSNLNKKVVTSVSHKTVNASCSNTNLLLPGSWMPACSTPCLPCCSRPTAVKISTARLKQAERRRATKSVVHWASEGEGCSTESVRK